jgi:DNA polymerase V
MSYIYSSQKIARGQPLPLFSFRVPAGFPSPATGHIEKFISLDELVGLRLSQTYLIRIQGKSMSGAGIYDADIGVVDRAIEPKPGMIVVAMPVCLEQLGRQIRDKVQRYTGIPVGVGIAGRKTLA